MSHLYSHPSLIIRRHKEKPLYPLPTQHKQQFGTVVFHASQLLTPLSRRAHEHDQLLPFQEGRILPKPLLLFTVAEPRAPSLCPTFSPSDLAMQQAKLGPLPTHPPTHSTNRQSTVGEAYKISCLGSVKLSWFILRPRNEQGHTWPHGIHYSFLPVLGANNLFTDLAGSHRTLGTHTYTHTHTVVDSRL